MKKIIIILSFMGLFSGLNVSAQENTQYVPGYIIDAQGQKLRVYIWNEDWEYTPSRIRYKMKGVEKEAGPANIKEIGIPGKWKYISATVDMDTVPDLLNRLSHKRQPDFVKKTVFLKALVEGAADLYVYREPHLVRFYYRKGHSSPLKPLTYRRYFVIKNGESLLARNTDYKQQLYNDLKCPQFGRDKYARLKYEAGDMKKFFQAYNKCRSGRSASYSYYQSPNVFRVFVMAHGEMMRVNPESKLTDFPPIKDQPATSMGGGLGLEYLLPFFHNKWSLWSGFFFRSISFHYEDTYKHPITGDTVPRIVDLNHRSLEIPLAVRYYFLTGERLKGFAEVAYSLDIDTGSRFVFIKDDVTVTDIKNGAKGFWTVGAGLHYGALDVALLYNTNASLIKNLKNYRAPAHGFGLKITYTFLEKEIYK